MWLMKMILSILVMPVKEKDDGVNYLLMLIHIIRTRSLFSFFYLPKIGNPSVFQVIPRIRSSCIFFDICCQRQEN